MLRDEVRAGRLAGDAVNAVLRVAGHRVRAPEGSPMDSRPARSTSWSSSPGGTPNKEIAGELGISPKTVSAHLERVYAKAGVSTRAGATLYAMRHGLLALDHSAPPT